MSGNTNIGVQNPATVHQGFQPLPNLEWPIANENLTITIPWYNLLVNLWRRAGGSVVDVNATNLTNVTLGGGPIVLNPVSSPFTYTATVVGTFLVTRNYSLATGKRIIEAGIDCVEFSRDSGMTWYLAGMVPCMVLLANTDMIRVSWSGSRPPMTVWLPISN